jgi:hypothetical protein
VTFLLKKSLTVIIAGYKFYTNPASRDLVKNYYGDKSGQGVQKWQKKTNPKEPKKECGNRLILPH